jgi:uncharacterized membrane protein
MRRGKAALGRNGANGAPMFYNDLAGRDIGRLAALSDGIFAFAFTLLVLDIHVPDVRGVHSEADLWVALGPLVPHIITAGLTFLTLGIFWVGQQTVLSYVRVANRSMAWIQIAFLFAVVAMPFSTALLSEFITYRVALLLYWFNIVALGSLNYVSWNYGIHAGLFSDDAEPARRASERRIFVGQSLYALGAALCAINTYVSITFIVLVQLNYAIAPKFRWLYRL